MRFIYTIIFLIFLSIPTIQAQRFIGSVVAGINVTQVDGDEAYGYKKVGFNGGGSVMLALDKKQRFFVTVELLYTQKGSQAPLRSTNVDYISYDDTLMIDQSIPLDSNILKKTFYNLQLDYVEVPLMFHFEDPFSKCAIGVGVSWSRLVRVKEISWGRPLTTDLQSQRYHKNEFSIIADVKIPIYKGLKLNFRYQYSIVPIGIERKFWPVGTTYVDNYTTRSPRNNLFSIRLIYSFNEKYVENMQTDKNGNRKGPRWVRDPNWYK